MKNRNVSVGLFVAGGLLLFGAGMFLIGDRRQAFGRHMEYYSEFVNLAGPVERRQSSRRRNGCRRSAVDRCPGFSVVPLPCAMEDR